ncbi:MAG: FliH/SctL family protein [Lysobacteraceae bacterium]
MSRVALDLPTLPRQLLGPAVLTPGQWAQVGQVQVLIEALERLHATASERIQTAEREARDQGTARAVADASARIAADIEAVNRHREQWLAQGEQRIAELACRIVEHLLPRLDVAELMPALVREAVTAAQAERFILVRVPTGARRLVEDELPSLRQLHPGVTDIEIVEDPQQPEDTCVVISESGEVRADLAQRLDLIRQVLRMPPSAPEDGS